MKLLTKELLQRFEKVDRQPVWQDPLMIAKFFDPAGAGTWWASEYYPDGKIFFGFASIFGDHNDEWGMFSLAELSEYRGRFGLGIERDLYFKECHASEIPAIVKQSPWILMKKEA